MHARLISALTLGFSIFSTSADAREPTVPLSQRGVDRVAVKDGPALLGAVYQKRADKSLTMAVERDWLKKTHPKYYKEFAAREAKEIRAAHSQLQKRIQSWIDRRKGDKSLVFFLEGELSRIEKLLQDVADDDPDSDESQFVKIEVPADKVDQVFTQPSNRKQIALLAWRERLKRVSFRSVRDLRRELKEQDVQPTTETIDLSDRLPPAVEDENDWAARMAIVEYQYRKPLDFQGMGGVLIQTGQGAEESPVSRIFTGLLQSDVVDVIKKEMPKDLAGLFKKSKDVGKLLGTAKDAAGLLGAFVTGNKQQQKSAIATGAADRVGVLGVRITQIDESLHPKRVSVEEQFLARMPDGKWRSVWSYTATLDGTKPRPEFEQRILQDPQVKKILDAAKVAGISTKDARLQTAIRYGAATMQAQQTADGKFYQFRDRHLNRLDGPPFPKTTAE